MKAHHIQRRLATLTVAMVLLSLWLLPFGYNEVRAEDGVGSNLALPETLSSNQPAKIGSSLLATTGPTQVVVQLKSTPLAISPNDKSKQAATIQNEQDKVVDAAAKFGAKELARLNTVLNAVIFQVDAGQVAAMAQELNVKSINKVNTYELMDTAVNNQIGATAAQSAGYRGQGKKVAVLDSGVDFTHASLGGPGTTAFYNTCYAQKNVAPSGACAAYFGPGAPKVIGGIDFVGETWPSTPETTDPNPIDFEGHGTHVADIIAGSQGVAPDAKIIAVKVCSAVSTSCSGLAILQGIEYAVNAGVDVMNLSLGSSYGQEEDDSSDAINNAVKAGVVAVISAGNSADKPYIVGSPSTAFGAISVAQTAVPSDKLYPIKVLTPTARTINYVLLQPWSPNPSGTITGSVQWGVGSDKLVCNPVPAGSFAGKIALIDRGTCAVSIKSSNASAAGAIAVIVANNTAGPPPSFSYGGGTVTVPTFTVSQADGISLRAAGTTVSIDPTGVSIAGTIVSTSSRGPFLATNYIKPDIGAPGASISAEVGTGTGTTAFGGTSGAAPVVSGAALLVRQKYPSYNPSQVKSLLMTSADTNVKTLADDGTLYPSPITRIGGGEVRVDSAINNGLLAQVPETGYGNTPYTTGSLSFGYVGINGTTKVLQKNVRVTNTTSQGRLYQFKPTFRDPADEATGAVRFTGPTQFWLNGGQTQDLTIQIILDGTKLRPWNLNAGINGNNGVTINELEYDGYIVLDGGANNTAKLAWQIFPHKTADTRVVGLNNGYYNGPIKVLQMANDQGGSTVGQVDVFNLIGTNGQQSGPPPAPGSQQVRIDLKAAGVQDVGAYLQFAVNTYGERATPVLPAEFDFYVDTDNNGIADYVVYNREQSYFTGGSFGNDGRVLVAVQKLTGTTANAFFYADVTYNSANVIMTVPKSALAITNGQTIGVQVLARDLYFTGDVLDSLPGNGGSTPSGFTTFKVGSPRYQLSALPWTNAGTISSDGLALAIGNNGSQFALKDNGAANGSSNGLLLMYRDGVQGREAEAVKP